MGSFRAEDMKKMYHIPDPQDIYDKTYMASFAKKNQNPLKLIQGWRVLDKKIKFDKSGMYSIASLAKPYNYASAMLCRLYGLPNNSKFSLEWILLIGAYVNSHIMNWSIILFNNLDTIITEYRQKIASFKENLPPSIFVPTL